MRISDSLQQFSREELLEYDSDPRYMFIFVNRDQLEKLAEGVLQVDRWDFAVNDAEEWVRYNVKSLRGDGKVFVCIFQRSDLVMAGFEEPIILDSQREEYEWNEKIDDGFEELRVNRTVNIEPVGYSCLFSPISKKIGDWII